MQKVAEKLLSSLFASLLLLGVLGCQQTSEPPPRFNENLGSQPSELLLPYQPVVSHKILQDPAQFPLPTAQAAPAEAGR